MKTIYNVLKNKIAINGFVRNGAYDLLAVDIHKVRGHQLFS